MELRITQPDEDKTDYLQKVCAYIENRGVKTREDLQSRFDALLTEFAMANSGHYDAKAHTLIMGPYYDPTK